MSGYQDREVRQKRNRQGLEKLDTDTLIANVYQLKNCNPWQWDVDYCRYCGARGSTAYLSGPWGDKTLCQKHHKLWKDDRLNLDEYKDNEPGKECVIAPDQNSERTYLINLILKLQTHEDYEDASTYKNGRRQSKRIKVKQEKRRKNGVRDPYRDWSESIDTDIDCYTDDEDDGSSSHETDDDPEHHDNKDQDNESDDDKNNKKKNMSKPKSIVHSNIADDVSSIDTKIDAEIEDNNTNNDNIIDLRNEDMNHMVHNDLILNGNGVSLDVEIADDEDDDILGVD